MFTTHSTPAHWAKAKEKKYKNSGPIKFLVSIKILSATMPSNKILSAMIFLILIAMSVFAGTPAYSSVKSSISEIQIVLDKENGNSYTYAKVYLSDASTDLWVLPLQMNGNDTYSNGGKLLLTQLEQAFSSGNAIIIQGTEMWGLGANADYTATFTGKRIGRTGGQITCV